MQQYLTLLPMILIFVIFYFMLIVPEKKRKKSYDEMLKALKVNDEVVTRGGIMGKIVNLQEDFVVLESRIVAMSFCEPRSWTRVLLPKTAWPPTFYVNCSRKEEKKIL